MGEGKELASKCATIRFNTAIAVYLFDGNYFKRRIMIREDIKKKFGLIHTSVHIGQSFINNKEISRCALAQDEVYFMDCSLSGQSLNRTDILIAWRKGREFKKIEITYELLETLSYPDIEKMLYEIL
jgi:hypothetical protein